MGTAWGTEPEAPKTRTREEQRDPESQDDPGPAGSSRCWGETGLEETEGQQEAMAEGVGGWGQCGSYKMGQKWSALGCLFKKL